MTKVVHVTTLEQWKSVLDVWFKQGFAWPGGDKEYSGHIFVNGGRYLFLDDCITYSFSNSDSKPFIEYEEFMEEHKEVNKTETYYVNKEKLDLINDLKEMTYPLYTFSSHTDVYAPLVFNLSSDEEKALLRYLGGDETVEFKVKEILYRLWRIDDDDDRVYMRINALGTPDWTTLQKDAFTASEEEIKQWQTPAWEIEMVY